MIYLILLIIAIMLNREDSKTVLLCLIVATSYYLPVNLISDYYWWYVTCMLAELAVIVLCIRLPSVPSVLLSVITTLLLLAHISSFLSADMKHYHAIAVSLEYLQITCFIIGSKPVIDSIVKLIENNILKRKYRHD